MAIIILGSFFNIANLQNVGFFFQILLIFYNVLDIIFRMYQDGRLIHADLSEYNILFYKKNPIFIDVSQAVLLDHPYAPAFLYRDISNINRYFASQGVETDTDDEIYEQITGSLPSPKVKSIEF